MALFDMNPLPLATVQMDQPQVINTSSAVAPEKQKDPTATANMWSNIANAASNMFTTGMQYGTLLNGGARDAQVQIAQANAQSAMANAQASNLQKQTFGIDNKYLYIGGAFVVVLILILVLRRPKA